MKFILHKQETTRLKFRLLQEDDFDSWLPLFKEQKLAAKYLGKDINLDAKTLCKSWFEKCFARYDPISK